MGTEMYLSKSWLLLAALGFVGTDLQEVCIKNCSVLEVVHYDNSILFISRRPYKRRNTLCRH